LGSRPLGGSAVAIRVAAFPFPVRTVPAACIYVLILPALAYLGLLLRVVCERNYASSSTGRLQRSR
ncbi:MAG: hypothetical protein O2885_12370, partial [Proteobacteria bacterium]|nr:hypothetical protein [Pseudomonadota bacterium]